MTPLEVHSVTLICFISFDITTFLSVGLSKLCMNFYQMERFDIFFYLDKNMDEIYNFVHVMYILSFRNKSHLSLKPHDGLKYLLKLYSYFMPS